MAFTAITSTEISSGKPVIGTGGFGQKCKDNFDDLNSRLGTNESLCDQDIRDDFHGTSVATGANGGTGASYPYTWDILAGDASTPALDGAPDHYCHLQNGAGTGAVIAGSPCKHRPDLDRDHSIVLEARIKHSAATDANLFFGFQDAALTLTTGNNNDTSDMIGFVRGTNSNTLKFRTAKASTNAETDNLGNFSGWQVIRITIVSLSSGADITVRAYTGSTVAALAEISGSPFTDETKIPNVALKPWFGSSAGGGTRHAYIDYALCYMTARSLSA